MADISFQDAEQIRHAYIVSAPSSSEALSQAQKIAQAAVCRGTGILPCGKCPACIKVEKGIHPDVSLIERLTDDKGKKRREIRVAQIRELSADATVRPNEALRKVYIIKEAELMNVEAQNAALKLFEEPPRGVIFVLCTTNPGMLLITVRSRCVNLNFAGKNDAFEDETSALAEKFLKIAAAGNPLALWRFCEEYNSISIAEMSELCSCISGQITEMLCGRVSAAGMSPRQLFNIESLMEKCISMLKVNVNVKQVFGLIEADTFQSATKK